MRKNKKKAERKDGQKNRRKRDREKQPMSRETNKGDKSSIRTKGKKQILEKKSNYTNILFNGEEKPKKSMTTEGKKNINIIKPLQ